jgi:hypothetical protein
MSKGERLTLVITILFGVPSLIFAGIQAWDVLDRRGAMSAAIAISVWAISLLMIGYSIYRNLRDARRAESLRAQIVTIKDEHKTHIDALAKAMDEAQSRYFKAATERDESQAQAALLAGSKEREIERLRASEGELSKKLVATEENLSFQTNRADTIARAYEEDATACQEWEMRAKKYYEAIDSGKIGQTAILAEYAAHAEHLATLLETVWHHWNNAGEKLLRPLSKDVQMPRNSGDASTAILVELSQLRMLYTNHINWCSRHVGRGFSNLMDSGSPNDLEYQTLLRDLSNHAGLLRDRAEKLYVSAVGEVH